MNVKRIVAVAIIIIVGIYLIYTSPVKVVYEINTIRTVLGENAENHDMSVVLTFKGYRSRSIFSPDKFMGSLSIDDSTFEMIEFSIGTEDVLLGVPGGGSDVTSIGGIYTDSKFDRVLVTFSDDGSWSTQDGIIFAGPAKNREEAIALANDLFQTTNSFFKEYELK